MRLYQGIRSLILTLFRKILFIWVRTDVSGNSVDALALDPWMRSSPQAENHTVEKIVNRELCFLVRAEF